MPDNMKQILDKFQQRLCESYQDYISLHQDETDDEIKEFVTYLIDRNIIHSTIIKRYAVLKEFEVLHAKKGLQKAASISLIASKFNLTERTIYSILKKAQGTF